MSTSDGSVSILVYVGMNYSSSGIGVIGDAVIAIGLYIAFYYGLTGFACIWYYRKDLTSSARNLLMQGIFPLTGALIMYFLGGWSIWLDWDVATGTTTPCGPCQARTGRSAGPSVIAVAAWPGCVVFYLFCRFVRAGAAFFKKQTLTRATPTLVPDE